MSEPKAENGSTPARLRDPFADLPEALTLEDVEKVTRIPKQTLRRLIDAGELPAWRLGTRNTRIWRDELREAIEAGRITGGSSDGEKRTGSEQGV